MARIPAPLAPVLGWLVLAGVSAAAILIAGPPAPLPPDAPPGRFSAGRAMVHVERIAERPHAWGTAANREVRAYCTKRLIDLGFDVRVQKAYGGLPAPLENILAVRRGRNATGLVMLCAHYDSTPFGPGAGDDAAGVAALLETARVLSTEPAPRNDLLILITDGEEAGLLGAKAFVAEDPLAEDVSVVLNFEARGASGRSLMFETSRRNAALIAQFAEVVERPAACSLMTAFYRLMPRTTDLAVFLKQGYPGLNFAFVGSAVHYHAPTDTPENLSAASLQHHGDQMLALARKLGTHDLATLDADGDAVYFDVLGRVFVQYPGALEWPLTLFVVLLALFVLGRAWRRGWLDGPTLAYGAWSTVRIVASCAVVVGAVSYALLEIFAGHVSRGAKATSSDPWFFLAFVLLCMACATGWSRFGTQRRDGVATVAGATLLMALALVATTAALPGAAFLILWPLLIALPAVHASLERSAPGVAVVCLVPGIVLLAPLAMLLLQGMGLTLAIVHAPLFGLFFALFAALLDRDAKAQTRLLVHAPAALAFVLFAVGWVLL